MKAEQYFRLKAMSDGPNNSWDLTGEDRAAIRAALYGMPNPRLVKALKAALMFHSGEPWTSEVSHEWRMLTNGADATTRGLCDFIRGVLEYPFHADVDGSVRRASQPTT